MADGVVTIAQLQSVFTADLNPLQQGITQAESLYARLTERAKRMGAAIQRAMTGSGPSGFPQLAEAVPLIDRTSTAVANLGSKAQAAWRDVAQTATASAGLQRLGGQVDALQRQLTTLGVAHPEIRFTTNGEAIAQQVTNLQTRIAALADKPYSLEVKAETAQVREDLARVQRLMGDLKPPPVPISVNTAAAESGITRLKGVLSSIGAGLGQLGLISFGIQAITSAAQGAAQALGVNVNAKLEQLRTAFTGLLGSAQAAGDYLNQLRDFANKTPFEFEDVTRGAQRFMGMGLAAQRVIPIMTDIGNAVAKVGGSSEEINRVEVAIGQIVAKGKVSAQEMNQLAENGIAGWQILANSLHTTVAQVMADAAEGKISAEQFLTAFHEANVGDAMAAQSRTLTGAMSTINDSVQQATSTAFRPLFDEISHGAQTTAAFLSSAQFQAWAGQVAVAVGQVLDVVGGLAGGLVEVATDAEHANPIMVGLAAGGVAALTLAFGALAGAAASAAVGMVIATAPITVPLLAVAAAVAALKAAWDSDFLGMKTTITDWADNAQRQVDRVVDGTAKASPYWMKKYGEDIKANQQAAAISIAQMVQDVDVGTEDMAKVMLAHGNEAVTNTGNVWDAIHQVTRSTLAQVVDSAAEYGAAQAAAYLNNILKTYGTGQPQVDAYLAFLIKRHDLKDALAIMGHNNAIAFLTEMVTGVANGIEKMSAAMSHLPGGEQLAAGLAKASQSMMGSWGQMTKQWDGFTGGFDAGAVKVEAAHQKAAKSAEKAAAAAAKAAAAQAKAAETAARQEVASTETIVRALESAAQQTDANSKGIGQSLVTLMGLLKSKIPPDMAFVRDAITRELAAAGSAAPPTVQKLHDDVVGILQRLKTDSRQEVRLMAQAALEQLGDFSTGAAAKMADAAAKVDAQALKMRQSLVKALGSLGDTAASPTGDIADFLVQALDVQKQAIDAQQPEIAAAASRWIDLANSANPPKLATLETDILGTLQAIATGSDPIMAAWARSVIGHIQETQAQAAAQAVQLQQTLVGALDTGLANTGSASTNTPTALLNIISAMKAAQAAGMGDVATDLQRLIDGVRSGAISGFTAISQAYQGILQQMAQSTDQQTALMAQQALAHYQEIRQAADAAAMQQATALQQQGQQAAETAIQQALAAQQAMAQAAQGLPAALEQALTALQGHTKSALDVLVSLAPLATQAAQAGMPGLAAVIQQYMDQAKNGVALDGQQMYQSLMQYLQQMATDGDATLSTFAQNAIAHLQQAQAIQQAQQSLVPYQAAVTAAQQRVQDLTQAVQDQQNAFNSIKGQIDAANQAIQDFARGPLQGENQFAVQMHDNEMATERLRQRLLQLPSTVGSDDPRRAGLERQIAELERRRQLLQSQYNTSIGDQRFQLQQQANTTPETSYGTASAGIAAAKDKVAELTPALQAAQDRLVALQRQQAAAQEASQAAAAALAAQQQAVQALTTALQNGQPAAAAYTAAMGQTQAATGQFATDTVAALAPVGPGFDALFGAAGDKAGPDNILNKLFAHDDKAFFAALDKQTNDRMDGYVSGTWASKLQNLDDRISDGLETIQQTALTDAQAIGNALVQGIQAPIDDAVSSIAASAAAAVTAAIEAARAAAGNPHSPSPTMAAKVGVPLAQGITAPMEAGQATAASAGAGMVQAAQQGAAGQIVANAGSAPVGTAGGAGPAVTIPIIINADGMTTHDLTRWRDVGREISTVVVERVTALFPNSQIATLMAGGTI